MTLTANAISGAASPDVCTDCGVNLRSCGKACGQASQFIQPDDPRAEAQPHSRSAATPGDEGFFGVTQKMLRACLNPATSGATWTGNFTLSTLLSEFWPLTCKTRVDDYPRPFLEPRRLLLPNALTRRGAP